MIKTFEEKKENAQLMRNIFGITAVLYIGFIIWIACIHSYEILWFAFNVWLLLVGIAVSFHSRKKDAELVLKYIEYVKLRHEFNKAIEVPPQIVTKRKKIIIPDRLGEERDST